MSALLFAAAGAAFVLLGASAAAPARPGLDIPVQVFGGERSNFPPSVERRPNAPRCDGEPCAGPTRVISPESARARTRAKLRFRWAAQASDVTSAAADENDAFIGDAPAR